MKILLTLLTVVLINKTTSAAVIIPVYFVWGQSNATEYLREGVQNVVTTTDPNSVVVVSSHPGNPIGRWWRKTAPYENLLDDFSILDGIKAGIESNGNTFHLTALIGMQGESDRFNPYDHWYTTMVNIGHAYEERYGVEFGLRNSALILGQSAVNKTYTTEGAELARVGLYTEINPAQRDAAAFFGGIALETEEYDRTDFWHLTRPAAIALGEEMGFAALTSVPEPSSLTLLTVLITLSFFRIKK